MQLNFLHDTYTFQKRHTRSTFRQKKNYACCDDTNHDHEQKNQVFK